MYNNVFGWFCRIPNHGTRLHCKRFDVAQENFRRLSELTSENKNFISVDGIGESGTQFDLKHLQKNCPATDNLVLKIGARVMLLKNLDTTGGLVCL